MTIINPCYGLRFVFATIWNGFLLIRVTLAVGGHYDLWGHSFRTYIFLCDHQDEKYSLSIGQYSQHSPLIGQNSMAQGDLWDAQTAVTFVGMCLTTCPVVQANTNWSHLKLHCLYWHKLHQWSYMELCIIPILDPMKPLAIHKQFYWIIFFPASQILSASYWHLVQTSPTGEEGIKTVTSGPDL